MQHPNGIKHILAPIIKRWYIIVACLLLSVLGAIRYMQIATPKYQASATIKVEDKSGITDTKLFKDFDVFNNNNRIETEVEVLKSRFLFEKALEKLDFFTEYYYVNDLKTVELYHTCPFTVNYSITDTTIDQKQFDFIYTGGGRFKITYQEKDTEKEHSAKLGELISGKGWQITVLKNKSFKSSTTTLSDKYRFIIYTKQALAQKLMEQDYLVRAIDKDVNIIKIYYNHPVAEKAMRMVNAISQAYIEQGITDKQDLAGSTLGFINQQLEAVTQELNKAQNAIKKYKVENEIVNIPQQTDATFRTMGQLEIQKVDINMQLAILENLSEYLRRNKEINLSGPEYSTIADPLFTEGVSKLNNKFRERSTMLSKFTENDPHIYNIDADIAQLRNYLIESVNNTRKKLLIRQEEVYGAIDEQKASFDGVPEKESTLNELSRNFYLYEKVYNFLIEKRMEALITTQVNVSLNKILEAAVLPSKPMSPIKEVIWGVALFIGLVIGILVAYVRHYIKSSVSNREDIEKTSSIPFIGNVELFAKNSSGYNSFAALTTRVLMTGKQNEKMVITVTSTVKGEGKSYIATGLARTMAAMDKKVCLVDMNAHNPTLDEWFDIKNTMGIADVYFGKTSVNDVINITAFPNLDLINVGQESFHVTHLLATQKTHTILEELKEMYDVVIVDTPESGKHVDAIPFMKWSDMNLYVVKADDTKTELIANAELVKEEYRLNEVYFVLNAMSERRNHTGYIKTKKLRKNKGNTIPQLTSLFTW